MEVVVERGLPNPEARCDGMTGESVESALVENLDRGRNDGAPVQPRTRSGHDVTLPPAPDLALLIPDKVTGGSTGRGSWDRTWPHRTHGGRALFDGSNLYRQLEVRFEDGMTTRVRLGRTLWKELNVGDRLVKESGADPARVAP